MQNEEDEMKTLEKASNFVGKYMAWIVIAVAALALFAPQTCLWIKTSGVNTLLGIVMFGMGLTLKASDFAAVFTRPKDVFIGAVAQFMTPLLTLLYAGKTVDVNAAAMFLSVLKVVLLPILLGFVVNHFFAKFTEKAAKALPLVSTTAIVLIIAAVVSVNSQRILTSGLLILAVVVCHNVLGYLTGYGVARALRLDTTKCRAISIEVGMQNSGLATSLAATHFAQYPLATIPGAVFSVWHNISGALLANFFNRQDSAKRAAESSPAAAQE